MADKHEKRIRWVQRGDFAVEVEVDVVSPSSQLFASSMGAY